MITLANLASVYRQGCDRDQQIVVLCCIAICEAMDIKHDSPDFVKDLKERNPDVQDAAFKLLPAFALSKLDPDLLKPNAARQEGYVDMAANIINFLVADLCNRTGFSGDVSYVYGMQKYDEYMLEDDDEFLKNLIDTTLDPVLLQTGYKTGAKKGPNRPPSLASGG
ncbi:MAG TPA: hypothetical protein VLG38_00410 [Gammaproteobacteria bacterium]|nr:hypothetical protein [Gammaproteobacteria bacterium]